MARHPAELGLAIPGPMFVLNFHGIAIPRRKLRTGEADTCIDRGQFTEILDAVAGRDNVLLTFDDGNSSDVTEALPELARRGLRAQFFVCAARFGIPGFLDQDDLRELRSAGMSIGSHGMDHVRWRKLDPSGLHREIVLAKQILEDALAGPVATAACPFGAYDRRTLRALRAAGFTRVYTSDGGRASASDWLVARTTVTWRDSADSIDRLLNGSPITGRLARQAKGWIKRWR
jgi:peptidoglycan/xylan/chitin deacetylase (PgdA/CDA1 family)